MTQDVVRLIQPEGMLSELKSTSTSLILLGVLAVIAGIRAIACRVSRISRWSSRLRYTRSPTPGCMR